MLSQIIKAEHDYNALLPVQRLEHSPPAALLAAAQAWSGLVWDEAERLGPIPLSDEDLTNGRNLANNPVFICGVHRSGTTLVQTLLDGHPQLVVLPSEGTYYTNLEFKLLSLPQNEQMAFLGKEWLRRFANPINQPPYWLLGRSGDNHSPYVDFARYFMAWWAVLKQTENTQWPHTAIVLAYAACTNNLTAKLWVDKTPANERFIERIWHEMPNAKVIHVVRNPVDTLASRKKMEPGITMRNALRDMKIAFNTAIDYAHDLRFLLLHYEELCENPQTAIQQMAAFLDIENLPMLGQATVAGMPAEANSSFNREAASAGKIIRSMHQPNILTKAEHQLTSAYMGKLAARLKYPLPKVNLLYSTYLKLINRLL